MKTKKFLFNIIFLAVFTVLSVLISSHKGIWRDEAFSILISKLTLSQIIKISSTDFSPPLFYLILHIWGKFFGYGSIVIRFLPLIFALLSLILIFRIKPFVFSLIISENKNEDKKIENLLFYLLVVFNLVLIYFSAELRSYSMLTFLVLVSSVLAYLSFFRTKWLYFLLLVITNTAILYTHNLGFIWVFAQFLAMLLYLFIKKRFALLWQLCLSFFITLLLFFPWFKFVFSQTASMKGSFWITFDWIKSLNEYSGLIVFNEGIRKFPQVYDRFILLSYSLVVAGFIYILVRRKKVFIELSSFIFTLAGMYVFSVVVSPVLYVRYMSYVSPFALLLVFIGFVLIKRLSRIILLITILIYFSLAGVIYSDFVLGATKTDYKKLSNLNNLVIYTDEPLAIMPCVYYSSNCFFVGDIKNTPHYIGASQLNNIQAINAWVDINNSQFAVLYQYNLDPKALEVLTEKGFKSVEKIDLGDGIYFEKLSKIL